MAVKLPNGATLSIASTYASPKNVTAITNANPGVASVTANGYSNDDPIEMTSGWSKLNNRIIAVASAATDTFGLKSIDTTSTTTYPAAGGTGTCRKVTAWTQIVGVLELTAAGGDQQFTTYEFLESDDQFQIPTVRAPQSLTFRIGDDTTLAHYAVLAAADADRAQRALKVSLPGGSII